MKGRTPGITMDRTESNVELKCMPIDSLYGIGKAKTAAYRCLGVQTIYDLLYFFPRAYENRGQISLLADAKEGIKNSLILTVATEPKINLIRRGMSLLKFRAFDESGSCDITYFNQDYLRDKFHIGSTFRFWGRVEHQGGRFSMSSPVAEPYAEGCALPPLIPVYHLSEGLTSGMVGKNVAVALSYAAEYLKDPLPPEVRDRHKLCTIHFALRQIHEPNDYESLAIAKKRLIFDEFFVFATGMALNAKKIKRPNTAPSCTDHDISGLLSLLPYTLTDAQQRAVEEISLDMLKTVPMSRIIIGDVGCGKTVCAAAAMYIAVKNGGQAALMAPTEILATQHYNDLEPLFSKLGVRCVLLTGSTSATQKRKIYAELKAEDGEQRADIVIGTHALISAGVEFYKPYLCVVDEQHRFGVNQRALLSHKFNHSHMLVMSATPIPRSLALVMYGDLRLSKIDTMPAGRQRVDTFFVDESYRERLDTFICKQTEAGNQVYIVCPAVEEKNLEDDEIDLSEININYPEGICQSKNPPLKAAVKYAQDLKERLPGQNIAFVHGKLKASEKDKVMKEFTSGNISILVSTTVIEVGVNVPNATLMIVENAERFGLSQLHQLRGRVGRGDKKSYCVLVCGAESKSRLGEGARRRLETMCRSYNGFEIAEEDLRLRGPGDFLANARADSIRQSGELYFKIADMCEDSELMNEAFNSAREYVESDPKLENNSELAGMVERMFTIKSDVIN